MNMKKHTKLQSRREFFKEAAKQSLPILGAIILSAFGFHKINAAEIECYCTSCVGSCSGDCYSSCLNTCQYTCNTGCYTTCKGACVGTCQGTCSGSCSGSSYYY